MNKTFSHRLKTYDASLTTRLTVPRSDARWPIAVLLAHTGDGNVVYGSLLLVIIWAVWQKNWGQLGVILFVLVTLLVAATVVVILKHSLRRARPHNPAGFVQFKTDVYSFPSGHSARMATLGMSFWYFYPTIGAILLLLAALVALARVGVGVHYLSDVSVGYLVGLACPIIVRVILLSI